MSNAMPRILVQFALMGDVFARTVLGLVEPTVGLLNVGSEDLKGNEAVRSAGARLRGGMIPIRFHGFVEGDDIAAGTVDVVVTDGFTGNVAVKTAEGTAKLFSEFLEGAFRHSLMARIGYLFARNALRKLWMRIDPRLYNGAIFLGLDGIAVKSHGSTDALGFANAIGVAVDMKVNGFLDKITGRARPPQCRRNPRPRLRRSKSLLDVVALPDRRMRRLSARADRHQRRARRCGSTPPTHGSASAPASASAAIAAAGELTSDLALAAAQRALASAGVSG